MERRMATGRGQGYEGGCLCGAVRYRLRDSPFDAGYCHCRLCQRSAGAPTLVFASVRTSDLEIVAGSPRRFRSTSFGTRSFCPQCGTQLFMQLDDEPGCVDFTVASLDDPAAVPPGFHIWNASRIAWFDTADALPRNEAARPKPSAD
jgi:hypothetical protein